MIVFVGIILLLVWLIDYAVHPGASNIVDTLLLFSSISFTLDILRERRRDPKDRPPRWDNHYPPGSFRGRFRSVWRWFRHQFSALRFAAHEPATNKVRR
jgi:hypothetical protein